MKNAAAAVIFVICEALTLSSAMAASVPACEPNPNQIQCSQHRELAKMSDDTGLFDTLMGGGIGKCRLDLMWSEHSAFFSLYMGRRQTVKHRIDLSFDNLSDRDAQVLNSIEGKHILDTARLYLQTCGCIW